MRSRFDPKKLPQLSKWREELAAMTIGKDSLYQDYYALKNAKAKAEVIKRSVMEILKAEATGIMPQKSLGFEL